MLPSGSGGELLRSGPMGLFAKDRNLARPPERVELPVRASDFRRRADELVLRLDAFLTHHLHWRSRNSIQELIKEGHVRVAAGAPDVTAGTGRVPGEAPVERLLQRSPGCRGATTKIRIDRDSKARKPAVENAAR